MRASEPRDPGTCGVAQGTGPAEEVPAGPGLGASPGFSRWAHPKLKGSETGEREARGVKGKEHASPPRRPRRWKEGPGAEECGRPGAGQGSKMQVPGPFRRQRGRALASISATEAWAGPAVPQPGKGHTVPCTPLRGAGTSQQQEGLAWAPQASPDPHGGSHGGDYYHHLYLKAVSYFQALECPFHQKVRWGNKLLDVAQPVGGRADTQAYK